MVVHITCDKHPIDCRCTSARLKAEVASLIDWECASQQRGIRAVSDCDEEASYGEALGCLRTC